MDLNYLVNTVLPQRAKEIKQGKHLATRQPIYVVFSLQENFCEGHSEEYLSGTNMKGIPPQMGYFDADADCDEGRDFKKSDRGMKRPEPVTRFYTDRFCGFFLTSEAAHAYKKYQKHNMHKPYVYVFGTGYCNDQMDKLFKND